ncbi:MAG: ROK family transcriptional regulator [Treponema sp.]|jgi:predicted NBD/HSP70 family sugar kinase|nr:ROK family transcriptional regulator [Treponema sp.]
MPLVPRYVRNTSNKPRNIKYHNQKLILSMFRQKDMLSITEIANQINLSKTTVTKVVNNFEAKGMVLAAGKGNSTDTGGKKPEMFAFNPSFSWVIVLTVTIKVILGAIMDLKCNVIAKQSAVCVPNAPYQDAVQIMADLICGLTRSSGFVLDKMHPIIIGCEGIIDSHNGLIHYTIHHQWGQNLPLREDLLKALPFPADIYVDNNLRLAGYADMILNEQVYASQVVISTTSYAGGSVMEDRQLIHGINGFVGEFGHMIVEPHSDVQCHCGGYGCFEALVSPGNVLAQAYRMYEKYPQSAVYQKARDHTLSMADIFTASNEGDPLACALIDQVVHYFTVVIHNIVLLRDTSKIIIQGNYTAAGDYFLNTLRTKVNTLPFYKMNRDLPISYSGVSTINSYLVGAAYYGVGILLEVDSLYD